MCWRHSVTLPWPSAFLGVGGQLRTNPCWGRCSPAGVLGLHLFISCRSRGEAGPAPRQGCRGRCLHRISSLKPTGDKGDGEKTNSSAGKQTNPNTPTERLSQFSSETWIRRVTWPATFFQSLGDFSHGNLFRQLCNFDFQLIRFVLFGRLG